MNLAAAAWIFIGLMSVASAIDRSTEAVKAQTEACR